MKRLDVCWALSDGRAGNARQAEALALAVAAHPAQSVQTRVLQPHPPWRWLAPRYLPGATRVYGTGLTDLLRHPPALAIGCGRQAALATRLLRTRGSRVVQILDPRLPTRHWDMVVVPQHDSLRGDNVLTLLGSLHPVDDDWLAQGRAAFPALGMLPSPRTGVLIGGPSSLAPWSSVQASATFDALAAHLRAIGGSILASTSRRTPTEVAVALRRLFADLPGVIWCDEHDGPNPYAGILGWAERLVCTPDSVNLLSEACATRVPVRVLMPELARGRAQAFHRALRERGRLADMHDAGDVADAGIEPLRETARIALRIREHLQLR